jgi:hypothetical protein
MNRERDSRRESGKNLRELAVHGGEGEKGVGYRCSRGSRIEDLEDRAAIESSRVETEDAVRDPSIA